MKNADARCLRALLCLLLVFCLMAVLPVAAAETSSPNLEEPTAAPSDPPAAVKSVRVWFNDPTVDVGGEVTVTLSSSVDVAAIEMTALYDADYLNYVGCSGGMGNLVTSAEDGRIRISDRTASGEGHFYLELIFVARVAGTTVVRSGSCECTDGSGNAMDTTIGTAQVTVRPGGAAATATPKPTARPSVTPTAVPTASPTPSPEPTAEPTATSVPTATPEPTPFVAPTPVAAVATESPAGTVEESAGTALSPLAVIAVIVAGIFVIGVGIAAGTVLGGRRNRD